MALDRAYGGAKEILSDVNDADPTTAGQRRLLTCALLGRRVV